MSTERRLFSAPEIDGISDGLKRAVYRAEMLPETPVAAWFINRPGGSPEFWLGTPPMPGMQPLYYEPAREGQHPVAWRASNSQLITADPDAYRQDMVWKPLYLAR